MIISFYLFFCWFLFGILFTLTKRLPKQHLSFVFLFVDFVNTSISYLLSDPFDFYMMAKEASRYISFSLYQSIIIPALLTLIINIFIRSHPLHKPVVFLISICLFLSLDFIARYLNLFTYTGLWHLLALLGYRLILMLLTIFALKGFGRMCYK
ncbi:hypothetical protein [Paenibacillus sp. Soil787]|uniref:hypothetical protein n=1 Tax=Paenibacillus sp. Soil787 TaxID=1736411 RepID=UPI000702C5A7|nr:hypothetical protein [Paenibacillus sp. Soil787]KRF09915.1 hypothetical protein ASG93_18985 [Paenibacillus sp. Soil787]